MIAHAAAVARASSRALVVFDMPFGSYQESPEVAFAPRRARIGRDRLRRGQARGRRSDGRDQVAFLVRRGVPVMVRQTIFSPPFRARMSRAVRRR